MALLRYLSATIEFIAATFILRSGRIETAISINAALGMVGPTIFVLVSAIGLFGLSASVSTSKMIIIFTGVLMVLYGATR